MTTEDTELDTAIDNPEIESADATVGSDVADVADAKDAIGDDLSEDSTVVAEDNTEGSEVTDTVEDTDTDNASEVASDAPVAPANTPFVPENVSPEELDKIADTAVANIQKVLKHFEAGDTPIDEFEGQDGELILNVDDDNLAVLIGKYGRTLDSFQTLVSAMTTREIGYFYPVTVDVGGYRSRQRDKVAEIATHQADKALRRGETVELLPMSAFERRLVHMALRDNEQVKTYSEGSEPNRFVVIEPA